MSDINTACRAILEHNLSVIPREKILIVTDEKMLSIGEAFLSAAEHLGASVKLITIPVPACSGQEPPAAAGEEMLRMDVILMPTQRSLSWTRARQQATEKGARIVSLPGITADVLTRNFPVDYTPIKERVNRLCDLLDRAETIHLTTTAGSDLRLNIAGRKGHGRKGGLFRRPGEWGNLPCGEVFIAPLEGTGEGIYWVDVSCSGLGKVEVPIRIEVENGRAVSLQGGAQAQKLKLILDTIDHPDAFNLAEFGIGANDRAEISGITLEDEKVMGTCHIALGDNVYFGGRVKVGIHLDGVINRPDIVIDEQPILHNGIWLL